MSAALLKIRSASFPADEAAIAKLAASIWKGGAEAIIEHRYGQIGMQSWQENQAGSVLDWLRSPGACAYVIDDPEDGSEIVGFCSIKVDPARNVATVGYNGVALGLQGKGLGGIMMNFIMERIRESGMGYAEVLVADNDAHAPARRLYEKAGFEPVYALRYLFQKIS